MNASAILAAGVLLACALTGQTCFQTNLGTDLNLGDESCSPTLPLGFTFLCFGRAYSSISVCSNGYLWLGSGSYSDFTPSQAELDAQGPRICPLWMDLDPSAPGSGHVYANNTMPGKFMVTWNNVFSYSAHSPTSFQVVIEAATNSITITYGTLGPSSSTQGGTTIIGIARGGNTASANQSLATRPLVVTSDNFADVLPTPQGTAAPYGNTKMSWAPRNPGYLISDQFCVPNTLPSPATAEPLGVGCPSDASNNRPTVYETFTPGNIDILGASFRYQPNGNNGFLLTRGTGGLTYTGFTNNLGAIDDSSHLVNLPFPVPHAGAVYTQIRVSSNGFITFGATDADLGCCQGSGLRLFTSLAPRLAAWWSDINPSAGGGVFADLDPLTNEFCITWDNVPEFGVSTLNTFQIALDVSGAMKVRLSSVASIAHTFVCGYSYGGGSNPALPGPTDLSAISTFDTGALIVHTPLTHAAQGTSRPIMGTSFLVDTTGIPPAPNGNVVGMFIMFQLLDPGVPLDVIGATNCTAYGNFTDPDAIFGLQPVLGATTVTMATPIPNLSSILGLQVVSQTFSDDLTANAFGFKISNGLRWTINAI